MYGDKDKYINKIQIRMIPSSSSISPKQKKFSALLNNTTATTKANSSTISFDNKKTKLSSLEKNSNLKNSKNTTENLNLSKHYLPTNNSNTDTSTYINTINTCSFTSPKITNNNKVAKSGLISSNILSSISTRFFSKNNSKQKNLTNVYNNINIADDLNDNLICKTQTPEKKEEEHNSQIISGSKKTSIAYLNMKSSTCRNSQNINSNNKRLSVQKNPISHLIDYTHDSSSPIEDRNKLKISVGKAGDKENLLTHLIKKSLKKSLNDSNKKENSNLKTQDASKSFLETPGINTKNNLHRNSNIIEKISGKSIPSINNLIQENLFNNANSNNKTLKKDIKPTNNLSNSKSNFTNDDKIIGLKLNFNKNSEKKEFSTTIDVSSQKNQISLNNNKINCESKSPEKRNPKEETPNKLNKVGEINFEDPNAVEKSKDFTQTFYYSSHKKTLSNKKNSISNCTNTTSTKKFSFKKSNEEKQNQILIFNSAMKHRNSPTYIKYPIQQQITSINDNQDPKIFNGPLDQKVNSNISLLSNDFKEMNSVNINNSSVFNSKQFNEKDENFFVEESKITQKDEYLIPNKVVGLKDNNMKINENPFSKTKSHKINVNGNLSENFESKANLRNLYFENIKVTSGNNNIGFKKNLNFEGKNRTQQLGFYSHTNLNNKIRINRRRENNFNNEDGNFEDSLTSENNKVFSFKKNENRYSTLEGLNKSVKQTQLNIAKKIDYNVINSPENVGLGKEEKYNNNNDININEIAFTPYLNKNSAEISDDNTNYNKQENKGSGIIGLTERLQRLGQKYKNLIKEPERISSSNIANDPELTVNPALSNANNYNELFNTLSSNVQEMNNLISSENYSQNNITKNLNPVNKIINNNLLTKENTVLFSSSKKNSMDYNISNNFNENNNQKNSDPVSNVVNFVDNKSSFVFSNDIRRNLNFQDSNLLSNINLDKNENLLITSKHHNRIFSNDRSRLFSDSLSLNYNDFSMNHLNSNPIENQLDKTEADKFVNLMNDGKIYKSNSNLISKDFDIKKQEIENNFSNLNYGDLKAKITKESVNNLNEILNYDADSLLYVDNINRKTNETIIFINEQKMISDDELRDSREIRINHLIDNHIKNKNSFLNYPSSNNFSNNFNKKKLTADMNDKEINFESSRPIRSEMNTHKGINRRAETEVINHENKLRAKNPDLNSCFNEKMNKNDQTNNYNAKQANSKLDVTECQYGVELNKQDNNYFKGVIDYNVERVLRNGLKSNGSNLDNRENKGSLSPLDDDKNKKCILF